MALTNAYLLKTSNLEDFFNAIRSARAPEVFTHKFLKDLEFGSSNDRLVIGVLKGLGFLSDDGQPTARYFQFLDQSQSARVLAEGIREAYDDLFAIRIDAQSMDVEEVRGKLKTLTQGQKSEVVINQMASTFRALCELADWAAPPQRSPIIEVGEPPVEEVDVPLTNTSLPAATSTPMQLHYNIQLILPSSRDPKVYDVLFAALRRHLF